MFGPARNGAVSRCDLILDLSGGAPLFPAHDLRDGYLRADPGDPAAMLRAVLKARDLVGTFDKPRYITFTARSLRAFALEDRRLPPLPRPLPDRRDHARRRPCRDRRRTSAPAAANARPSARPAPPPTRLPPADTLLQRLRRCCSTYAQAGGDAPVVLLHDEAHGGPLIDALARHGDGLPARVLPVAVNEVTQVGLEAIAAAFAYGAASLRFLLRGKAAARCRRA